jgi:hypothetical protein
MEEWWALRHRLQLITGSGTGYRHRLQVQVEVQVSGVHKSGTGVLDYYVSAAR